MTPAKNSHFNFSPPRTYRCFSNRVPLFETASMHFTKYKIINEVFSDNYLCQISGTASIFSCAFCKSLLTLAFSLCLWRKVFLLWSNNLNPARHNLKSSFDNLHWIFDNLHWIFQKLRLILKQTYIHSFPFSKRPTPGHPNFPKTMGQKVLIVSCFAWMLEYMCVNECVISKLNFQLKVASNLQNESHLQMLFNLKGFYEIT